MKSHLATVCTSLYRVRPRAWQGWITTAFHFQDAFEQGQVFLGSKEQGYEVCEDLPRGIRGNRWKVGLTVVTPERKFIFTCPSEKEQREWLESLQDVLSSPLSPLHLLSEKQGRAGGGGLGGSFG